MATRRGLLIDWGGVLTTDLFASFAAFCEAEGLEQAKVRDLFRHDEGARELLIEFECGRVDEREFEQRFAPMLGVDDEELVERMFAGSAADDEMLGAVKAARAAGIRTGLISNSWGDGLAYDQAMLDELFDAVVISGDVGLHKPQPEIFLMGAERIGVAPEECVFVDDLRENCAGAEAVGMKAILHRGSAGTLPQLEELLGVPVTDDEVRA